MFTVSAQIEALNEAHADGKREGWKEALEAAAQFVESHTLQEVKGLPHLYDNWNHVTPKDFELMFGTSKEHDALAAAIRKLPAP